MRQLALLFAPAAAALALSGATAVPPAVRSGGEQPRPAKGPARPRIAAAGPLANSTDTTSNGLHRVTFSPDGDGRRDEVTIRVRARRGDHLSFWLHPITGASSYVPAGTAARGVTTLRWDGKQPDGSRYPDGSYVLRVCDTTTHLCSRDRVLAHLRIISVWVRRATAVSAGETVQVHIATDRLGPYAIDLVSAATPDAEGIGTAESAHAADVPFRIPAVPDGGLWLLRVRSGRETSNFPLVVHEPTYSLASPPPHAVLVVYPLLTWRAYDVYDENRNGIADSWYAHPYDPVVPLYGPFEPPATDPSLEGREPNPSSQTAFAGWMLDHKLKAQHVTDVELDRMSQAQLQQYEMIVFEGHTEYYEPSLYAKLLQYRNAGGHLYFFQGNSFYGAAEVGTSSVVRLSYRYRTSTRSDFALAVTGFRSCCWPDEIRPVYHLAPGVVERLPWLFAGTGLQDGDEFGVAYGEVDTVDPTLSPPGTVTVASSTVPAFTPAKPGEPTNAWIGSRPIHYQPAWLKPQKIAIAYAQTGKGEVFSWANTGFLRSVRFRAAGVPAAERAQLDRVALNVWERFTR